MLLEKERRKLQTALTKRHLNPKQPIQTVSEQKSAQTLSLSFFLSFLFPSTNSLYLSHSLPSQCLQRLARGSPPNEPVLTGMVLRLLRVRPWSRRLGGFHGMTCGASKRTFRPPTSPPSRRASLAITAAEP